MWGTTKKLNFVIFCSLIIIVKLLVLIRSLSGSGDDFYNCNDEISGGAIEISGGATTKLLKLVY